MAGLVAWLLVGVAPLRAAEDPDDKEQQEETTATWTLLASREFKQIESLLAAQQKQYESGALSADDYASALRQVIPDGSVSPTWQQYIEDWVKAYPKSYSANYARGLYHLSYGWKLRGGGLARDTTSKQFEDLARHLALAEKYLLESVKMSRKPFPSYVDLVSVARGLSSERQKDYFLAAEKLEPGAMKAKAAMLDSLAPKWGGSFQAMDEFMRIVRTKPLQKEALARLEAQALYLKAEQATFEERPADAVALYRKAYHADPRPTKLTMLRIAAKTAKKAGRFDEAIGIHSEIIAIDPKYTKSRNNRGFLLETEKKDFKAAKADYVASAELGSDWAQNRLGWWYMTGTGGETKDFDLARTYFVKAIEKGNKRAMANLRQLELLAKTPR